MDIVFAAIARDAKSRRGDVTACDVASRVLLCPKATFFGAFCVVDFSILCKTGSQPCFELDECAIFVIIRISQFATVCVHGYIRSIPISELSFAPSVCNIYRVHIWTFPWLRRRHLFGSRRSASEERRLERVFRSTHRCSFSHERRGNGRARAAPSGSGRRLWRVGLEEKGPRRARHLGDRGGVRLRGRGDRCDAPRLKNRVRLSTSVFTFDPRASIEPALAPRASRRAGTPASVTSKLRENPCNTSPPGFKRLRRIFHQHPPNSPATCAPPSSIRPARASLSDPRTPEHFPKPRRPRPRRQGGARPGRAVPFAARAERAADRAEHLRAPRAVQGDGRLRGLAQGRLHRGMHPRRARAGVHDGG